MLNDLTDRIKEIETVEVIEVTVPVIPIEPIKSIEPLEEIHVMKPCENSLKAMEIESFKYITLEDLSRTTFKEFIDDLTYDIELKFKQGFTEYQICYRYIHDIINLDCLTGTNERIIFKNGYKKHVKLLVLHEDINKLLSRKCLKKAQQRMRSEYRSIEGMNDVRYIINNLGRILTAKIKKN